MAWGTIKDAEGSGKGVSKQSKVLPAYYFVINVSTVVAVTFCKRLAAFDLHDN